MSKTTTPPADESEPESREISELRAKLGIKRYRDSTDEHAQTYLTRVLTATGGDRITAAAVAGLNRTHLQALIKRHHVNVKPNLKNRGRRRTAKSESSDEASETTAADSVDW